MEHLQIDLLIVTFSCIFSPRVKLFRIRFSRLRLIILLYVLFSFFFCFGINYSSLLFLYYPPLTRSPLISSGSDFVDLKNDSALFR